MKKYSQSNFTQQLEHEINRIKDIIKNPKLVEDKFDVLINLHEGLEDMINNYFESSSKKVIEEVEEDLNKYCDVFKKRWKDDLKNLDGLNMSVLKLKEGGNGNEGKKEIRITTWNDLKQKSIDKMKNEVELFDESIYGELNEYADSKIKKEDLERKEIKEMIKMYNEIREEIEDGLDEIVDEVEGIEKKWMKFRDRLEDKGKKWLEVMYVCHLNYLDSVMKKKECALRVNGEEVKGKQSEWLKGWIV